MLQKCLGGLWQRAWCDKADLVMNRLPHRLPGMPSHRNSPRPIVEATDVARDLVPGWSVACGDKWSALKAAGTLYACPVHATISSTAFVVVDMPFIIGNGAEVKEARTGRLRADGLRVGDCGSLATAIWLVVAESGVRQKLIISLSLLLRAKYYRYSTYATIIL